MVCVRVGVVVCVCAMCTESNTYLYEDVRDWFPSG